MGLSFGMISKGIRDTGKALSNVGKGIRGESTKEEPKEEKEEVKDVAQTTSYKPTDGGETPPTQTPPATTGENMPSDERLKEIFNEDERLEDLAKINSYDFTYKPEMQDKFGLDDEQHTGVMYQELVDNPSFKGCTSVNERGYGQLNIPELTSANTAGIGDLARKVLELEEKIIELENRLGDR